jgi:hypothetical protein
VQYIPYSHVPLRPLEELAFVPLNAFPQQAFSGIPIEASSGIAVCASIGRCPRRHHLLVLFLSREQVVCNCVRSAPRRRLTNVSAIRV